MMFYLVDSTLPMIFGHSCFQTSFMFTEQSCYFSSSRLKDSSRPIQAQIYTVSTTPIQRDGNQDSWEVLYHFSKHILWHKNTVSKLIFVNLHLSDWWKKGTISTESAPASISCDSFDHNKWQWCCSSGECTNLCHQCKWGTYRIRGCIRQNRPILDASSSTSITSTINTTWSTPIQRTRMFTPGPILALSRGSRAIHVEVVWLTKRIIQLNALNNT